MMFEGSRSSLHIRPAPRGTIIGPVPLCVDDTIVVNCTLGGVSGNKTPSEIECINQILQVSKVDFVLVIEETVFHSLLDMDFHKNANVLW
jgi:DNA topoisomerase VI subunit A